MQSNLTTLTIFCSALALATSCASTASLQSEEGPTPDLLASDASSQCAVAEVTSKRFPDSDEMAPAAIDGRRIAFVTNANGQLDIRAVDYVNLEDGASSELVASDSDEKAPFVDAKGVCYFVADPGGRCQVFSGNLPKVESRRVVVTGLNHVNWPHLSADGRRLLYSALNAAGRYEVWYRNFSEGSDVNVCVGQRARWNPRDPDEFVFVREEGGVWSIFKHNLATRAVTRLTRSDADRFDPEFSPDGELIAFVSNESSSSDIRVMRADGSTSIVVDTHGARDCQPTWTPDGQSLLFTSDRQGSFDIYRVALEEDLAGMRSERAAPSDSPSAQP